MNIHEIFNDSYERCQRNPKFIHAFYDILLKDNETFQKIFDGINMDRQIKMLKTSIILMFLANTSDAAKQSVRLFGRLYIFNGISPMDVDYWFESLLLTVKLCDHLYNKDTEKAWTQYFNVGLEIIKSEYLPIKPVLLQIIRDDKSSQ